MTQAKIKIISKFEIYIILESRLTSQDRNPKISKEKFYFSPKLYDNTLFKDYKMSYSNELVNLQINNMKFYYLNKSNLIDVIKFNEISDIYFNIETKHIYIKIDDDLMNLVSPIKKNHINSVDYELFKLDDNTFDTATIDHNPTFIDFIKEHLEHFNTLIKISKFIKSKRIVKYSDVKNRVRIAEYIKEENLADSLWEELKYISLNQTLELVHKNYNKKN